MVTLEQIQGAQHLLRGIAARTPVIRYYADGDEHLFLKPESLQPIGSFKLRGAYNKIAWPAR